MADESKADAAVSDEPGRKVRHELGPTFRYLRLNDNKLTLQLGPEAVKMLCHTMNQTDDSADDVFRKALALYAASVDAKQAGKAVGIAASPECLETEFVGF